MVIVVPLSPEQEAIAVFELLNVTGLPDPPPVAETTKVPSPNVFEASGLNPIT